MHPDLFTILRTLKTGVATQENLDKFSAIKLWCERTISTMESEYANRNKLLKLVFSSILSSEVLEPIDEPVATAEDDNEQMSLVPATSEPVLTASIGL